MNEIYKKIDKKINEANNIAIITHRNPDGDTMGSASAMKGMIDVNFQDKNIEIINIDWTPEALKYLNNLSEIVNNFEKASYDLYIFLDVASIKLTWFLDENNFWLHNSINIDHHISNGNYWEINLVNIDNPSTTSVLYDYFNSMNYHINPDIATALLTWIYTDTWALVFDNTTANTFDMVADLVSAGWEIQAVSDNIFLNSSINFVKLLWLTLERLVVTNWAGFSYLKKVDIDNSWCDYEELVWIVGRLNMLDGVEYMCFIYEKADNIVKWSLRTNKEKVDLTGIARIHGWWWHKKASAFTYFGHIETGDNWEVFIKTTDNNLIKFA